MAVSPISSPSDLKSVMLQGDFVHPIVFRSFFGGSGGGSDGNVQRWDCIGWNLDEWDKKFGNNSMKVRLGDRNSTNPEPQWESSCFSSNMTFNSLAHWDEKETTCTSNCGKQLSSASHWAYYDYVYLRQQEALEFLESNISWDAFGFAGRGAEESTVWIGTKGAHTPCHIDTYGCNLVTQVYGSKTWTLFPPTQSDKLYPSRIPYEESSIYSQVNFTNIDTKRFSKICESTPFVVTLNPGDVLVVPKHWWHFVESESFSISVNSWIELPSDDKDQLKEALVMYQVGSVCQSVESTDELLHILNPNMTHIATLSNEELVDFLTHRIKTVQNRLGKVSQKDALLACLSEPPNPFQNVTASDCNNYTHLEPRSFEEYYKSRPQSCVLAKTTSSTSVSSSVNNLLISSLCDPRVIDVVTEVLIEKLRVEPELKL